MRGTIGGIAQGIATIMHPREMQETTTVKTPTRPTPASTTPRDRRCEIQGTVMDTSVATP